MPDACGGTKVAVRCGKEVILESKGQGSGGQCVCRYDWHTLYPEEENPQLVFFLDAPFSVALSLEKARTQPGDGNNFKGDIRLVEFDFCGPNCFCGFSHNLCKGCPVGVNIQVPWRQGSVSKGANGGIELNWVPLTDPSGVKPWSTGHCFLGYNMALYSDKHWIMVSG